MAGALEFHYGPTATDPDPGAMWHAGCGGSVLAIDDGHICCRCGAQEDVDDDERPGLQPPTLVHLCPRCGDEIIPPADHYNKFASFWLCDSRTWPADCDCGGQVVLVEIGGSHYICRACGARYEEAGE